MLTGLGAHVICSHAASLENPPKALSSELICSPLAKTRYEARIRQIAVTAFSSDTTIAPKATPEEILAANLKIFEARDKLIAGEPFDQVWEKYSDPRASGVGGDLGFIGKGKMVSEIERAAFCLPVGKISPVIRSPFGFHLIQVTDERFEYLYYAKPNVEESSYYPTKDIEQRPVSLTQKAPIYPSTQESTLAAEVTVLFLLNEHGAIDFARIISAMPGGKGFEESVLDWAKTARFIPAKREGADVRSRVIYRFKFTPKEK